MGGEEAHLGHLRPYPVPNDLDVALPVELDIEAQLPQDILVGVLEEPLRLEPLVGVLFLVCGVEALAVDHLRDAAHNGRLDTRTEVQVAEVVAVEVVVPVVDPIAAGILPEQGQLMRRQPEDVELVLTHSR